MIVELMSYVRGAMLYDRGAMSYVRGAMLYARGAMSYARRAMLQFKYISTLAIIPNFPFVFSNEPKYLVVPATISNFAIPNK
jgi:hypothetical protein